MNGLKALEEIKDDMEYVTRLDFVEPIVRGEVKKNLFKIYHRELPQLDLIEKELKAFEIIKKKEVNVAWFAYVDNLEDYNKGKFIGSYLTQDEFDLLKEVMK